MQSAVSPAPAATDGCEYVRWPGQHKAGLWEGECRVPVQSAAPKGNNSAFQKAQIYKWLRSGFVLTTFLVYFHALQRDEFPLLQLVDLLSVVLQVCEVLMYLHGRSLVLRALSSHTVLTVHPGVAKVTGLGFMVPRYTVLKKGAY